MILFIKAFLKLKLVEIYLFFTRNTKPWSEREVLSCPVVRSNALPSLGPWFETRKFFFWTKPRPLLTRRVNPSFRRHSTRLDPDAQPLLWLTGTLEQRFSTFGSCWPTKQDMIQSGNPKRETSAHDPKVASDQMVHGWEIVHKLIHALIRIDYSGKIRCNRFLFDNLTVPIAIVCIIMIIKFLINKYSNLL